MSTVPRMNAWSIAKAPVHDREKERCNALIQILHYHNADFLQTSLVLMHASMFPNFQQNLVFALLKCQT